MQTALSQYVLNNFESESCDEFVYTIVRKLKGSKNMSPNDNFPLPVNVLSNIMQFLPIEDIVSINGMSMVCRAFNTACKQRNACVVAEFNMSKNNPEEGFTLGSFFNALTKYAVEEIRVDFSLTHSEPDSLTDNNASKTNFEKKFLNMEKKYHARGESAVVHGLLGADSEALSAFDQRIESHRIMMSELHNDSGDESSDSNDENNTSFKKNKKKFMIHNKEKKKNNISTAVLLNNFFSPSPQIGLSNIHTLNLWDLPPGCTLHISHDLLPNLLRMRFSSSVKTLACLEDVMDGDLEDDDDLLMDSDEDEEETEGRKNPADYPTVKLGPLPHLRELRLFGVIGLQLINEEWMNSFKERQNNSHFVGAKDSASLVSNISVNKAQKLKEQVKSVDLRLRNLRILTLRHADPNIKKKHIASVFSAIVANSSNLSLAEFAGERTMYSSALDALIIAPQSLRSLRVLYMEEESITPAQAERFVSALTRQSSANLNEWSSDEEEDEEKEGYLNTQKVDRLRSHINLQVLIDVHADCIKSTNFIFKGCLLNLKCLGIEARNWRDMHRACCELIELAKQGEFPKLQWLRMNVPSFPLERSSNMKKALECRALFKSFLYASTAYDGASLILARIPEFSTSLMQCMQSSRLLGLEVSENDRLHVDNAILEGIYKVSRINDDPRMTSMVLDKDEEGGVDTGLFVVEPKVRKVNENDDYNMFLGDINEIGEALDSDKSELEHKGVLLACKEMGAGFNDDFKTLIRVLKDSRSHVLSVYDSLIGKIKYWTTLKNKVKKKLNRKSIWDGGEDGAAGDEKEIPFSEDSDEENEQGDYENNEWLVNDDEVEEEIETDIDNLSDDSIDEESEEVRFIRNKKDKTQKKNKHWIDEHEEDDSFLNDSIVYESDVEFSDESEGSDSQSNEEESKKKKNKNKKMQKKNKKNKENKSNKNLANKRRRSSDKIDIVEETIIPTKRRRLIQNFASD